MNQGGKWRFESEYGHSKTWLSVVGLHYIDDSSSKMALYKREKTKNEHLHDLGTIVELSYHDNQGKRPIFQLIRIHSTLGKKQ